MNYDPVMSKQMNLHLHNLANDERASEINEHLFTIKEIAIKVKAKTIVELGTGSGFSLLALIAGTIENKGEVLTVDLNPCQNAQQMVKKYGENICRFVQGDDMRVVQSWTREIDLLLIDTSHKYDHTLAELRQWGKFVKSVIILHDIVADKGTWDAIYDYLKEHPYGFRYECHFWNNGLGILWRQ